MEIRGIQSGAGMTFPAQPEFDIEVYRVYCFSYLWLLFNGAPADCIKAAAADILRYSPRFGRPVRDETVH